MALTLPILEITGNNWKYFQNNVFSTWSGGTGIIVPLYVNGISNAQANSNTFTNITGASTICGIHFDEIGSTDFSGQIQANSLTNLSSTGGNVTGILFVNKQNSIRINNNTITNLSNTATNATVSAISASNGGGSYQLNIFSNTISNISNSGTGADVATCGIHVFGPDTGQANVYNNKIVEIAQNVNNSNSRLYGVLLASAYNATVYNNFISNLKAPTCNNTNAVTGIGVTSTINGANYRLFSNTVVLDGTSSASNFGSDCVSHISSANAAVASLTLINNILVNLSTPKGTGLSVAVRRNGVALNNYHTTSNNNLFFVGTPSANKLFYSDGTNSAQTLSQLTAITTPRETVSISVNPVFVDAANGDLHVIANQNCKLDGTGQVIPFIFNVTDQPPNNTSLLRDIDNQFRNNNFPDIGAHEFSVPVSTYSNAGTWSLPPSINNDIVIDDSFTVTLNTQINGCKCTVNPGKTLTIESGGVLNLQNKLTVGAGSTVNIKTSASLVQEDNAAMNVGSINVQRITSPYENFDYVYWSSPVIGSTIGTPFATWRLNRAYQYVTSNFSDLFNGAYPQTTGSPDGFDDNGNDWQQVSGATTMVGAKGYIVMTPATTGSTTANVIFNGVPNNGIFSIPLALSANNSSNTDDFNLVGNPYPSALDADAFINTNIIAGGAAANNVSGTLSFWTHVGNIAPVLTNPGPDANNYNANDYATYTLTGGVGVASGSGSTIPTGKIASGQAFFVEAETANNLVFNNSMRGATLNNGQFFRTNNINNAEANNIEKDRLRLNFKNVDNMFSQQLIGYFNNATLGYDYGYDGIINPSQNYVSFYSMMNNNPNLYRIQAKPTWNVNDSVPLGFSSAVSGSSSISIGTLEGVFNLASTNVYLQDNLLNVTHNLKQSPYTFTTAVGTFNTRFVLKYVSTTLGSNDNVDYQNTIIVAKKDQQLVLKSAFLPIEKVSVFDLLGRKVYENNQVKKNEFWIDNLVLNQQTIIVKITLENGTIVSRKVVF